MIHCNINVLFQNEETYKRFKPCIYMLFKNSTTCSKFNNLKIYDIYIYDLEQNIHVV